MILFRIIFVQFCCLFYTIVGQTTDVLAPTTITPNNNPFDTTQKMNLSCCIYVYLPFPPISSFQSYPSFYFNNPNSQYFSPLKLRSQNSNLLYNNPDYQGFKVSASANLQKFNPFQFLKLIEPHLNNLQNNLFNVDSNNNGYNQNNLFNRKNQLNSDLYDSPNQFDVNNNAGQQFNDETSNNFKNINQNDLALAAGRFRRHKQLEQNYLYNINNEKKK